MSMRVKFPVGPTHPLFLNNIIFLMIIFSCNDMISFNSNLLIYLYYIGFALLVKD